MFKKLNDEYIYPLFDLIAPVAPLLLVLGVVVPPTLLLLGVL